jgi:hypothetical protein
MAGARLGMMVSSCAIPSDRHSERLQLLGGSRGVTSVGIIVYACQA